MQPLLPTADTWTLSIQRQLTDTIMVEAAYSGMSWHPSAEWAKQLQPGPVHFFSEIRRQPSEQQYHFPGGDCRGITMPYPGFTGSVAQALRPWPQVLAVDTAGGGGDHSGSSSYNAFIARISKRFGSGLTFQSSYVFSKMLTDSESGALSRIERWTRPTTGWISPSAGSTSLTTFRQLSGVLRTPLWEGQEMGHEGCRRGRLSGDSSVGRIGSILSGLPVALDHNCCAVPYFC